MPNIALAVGLGKASPLKRPLGCDTKSHIWLIGKAPRCLSNPHLSMVDPALQRAGAREIARETRTPYNLQELKNKEI